MSATCNSIRHTLPCKLHTIKPKEQHMHYISRIVRPFYKIFVLQKYIDFIFLPNFTCKFLQNKN